MSGAMARVECAGHILFAYIDTSENVIDFKCRSNNCGAGSGMVIIHRFSTQTGDLLRTFKFKDPSTEGRPEGGR